MEAIFAKSIDVTYVGPNPAINAYVRSRGQEIRIVAGSVNGGSALVVHKGSALKTPADFRGKKIATRNSEILRMLQPAPGFHPAA